MVYVWRGVNQGVSVLDVPMNLEDMITMDMGRAYIGIHSDGYSAAFATILRSLSLQAFNTFNAEDPWNGLSVSYVCKFPVDLVFSPTVLDKYRNVFRLLFPLRVIQSNLNISWNSLNRSWAVLYRNVLPDESGAIYNELLDDQSLFNTVCGVRMKMSFVIDNLLSYFYLDVLEVNWIKMKNNLKSIKEFEELRRVVSNYLESIYVLTFLNTPAIVQNIFSMVRIAKKFVYLVERIHQGEKLDDLASEPKKISREFDSIVIEFMRHVNNLNQGNSSQYLSQLLTRLDFNDYYQTKINEMPVDGF